MQLLHGMQLEPRQSVLEGNGFAGNVRDTVQHQILLALVVVEYLFIPFIKEMLLLDAFTTATRGIWLAWIVWCEDLAITRIKIFNLREGVPHLEEIPKGPVFSARWIFELREGCHLHPRHFALGVRDCLGRRCLSYCCWVALINKLSDSSTRNACSLEDGGHRRRPLWVLPWPATTNPTALASCTVTYARVARELIIRLMILHSITINKLL